MDGIVERGRLYDFYGELLTPHQRKIYEAAVYDDLSLAEIAEEEGISRQGVHDIIKRVTVTLEDYENKLHMAERFDRIAARADELKAAAESIGKSDDTRGHEDLLKDLGKIAESIIEDMR